MFVEIVDVIKEVEKGVKLKHNIIKEYGILTNTLLTYLKNKRKIMQSWNLQNGENRKHIRNEEYSVAEECTLK